MIATRCPCPAKQRYATAEAARLAADGLVLVAEGVVMRPYRCPCGWFHLTRRQARGLAWAARPERRSA